MRRNARATAAVIVLPPGGRTARPTEGHRRVVGTATAVALLAASLAIAVEGVLARLSSDSGAGAARADVATVDGADLADDMAAARYFAAFDADTGWSDQPQAWTFANPARGFTALVSDAMVRVARDGMSLFTLRPVAFGTESAAPPLPGVDVPHAVESTLVLERGGITEWYRNDARGLEQGFTVAARPGGDGHLVLDLATGGDLTAVPGPDPLSARFVDANGTVAGSYEQLKVLDATGAELPAFMVVRDGVVRIDVDDDRATYPVVIDPLITTAPRTMPEADAAVDRMGTAVAKDGDVLAIAVPGDDDVGRDNGTIQVYDRADAASPWVYADTLSGLHDPGRSLDSLGVSVGSVDVDGDTIVAGADLTDVDAAPGSLNAGAVFVWQRVGEAWEVSQRLLPGDSAGGQRFGSAVDLDGDTLAIGAVADQSTGVSNAGAAYVFTRLNGTTLFSQQAKLVSGNPAVDDSFGFSVALDGATLVVGEPGDDALGANAGTAFVYHSSGSVWTFQEQLSHTNPQADGAFGRAVDLRGTTLVVGAPGHQTTPVVGQAYRFEFTGNQFVETQLFGPPTLQTADAFGWSLDIDDDTNQLVVGEPRWDSAVATDVGRAHVFSDTGQQTFIINQSIMGPDRLGHFGEGVAVEDLEAVAGAPFDTDNFSGLGTSAGAAYVFRGPILGSLAQTQVLTPIADSVDVRSGSAVDQANDILAVGAPGDQLNSSGDGAVRVYRRVAGAWELDGTLAPNPTFPASTGSGFGAAVSVYDGGSADFVLVGAPNDVAAGAAGSAFLFRDSGNGWVLQEKLVAPDPNPADRFGADVEIQGNIIIGAPGDDAAGVDAGAAYFWFGLPGLQFSGKAAAPGTDAGDRYGEVIAGNLNSHVVIASPGRSPNIGLDRYLTNGATITHLGHADAAPFIAAGFPLGLDYHSNLIAAANPTAATVDIFRADTMTPVGEIPSPLAGDSAFGASIAFNRFVAQDRLAIGAPFEEMGGTASGLVYLYQGNGNGDGAYTLAQQVQPPAPGGGLASFGWSVTYWSEHGGLAIGAPGLGTDLGSRTGAVFHAPTAYREVELITGTPLPDGAYLGYEIDSYGDTVFIAAVSDTVDGVADAGAVHVWRRIGNDWVWQQRIHDPDPATEEYFGQWVEVDDDGVLYVGCYACGGVTGTSGEILEFTPTGTGYALTERIFAPGADAEDQFGAAFDISGSHLWVSAYTQGPADEGVAYAFERDGDRWELVQTVTGAGPEPSRYFPLLAVAVDGDTAVLGNPQKPATIEVGEAYVYEWNGTAWALTQTIQSPVPQDSSSFAWRAALSGDRLMLAEGLPDDSGMVHTYTRSGPGSPFVYDIDLTSYHPAAGHLFGYHMQFFATGPLASVLDMRRELTGDTIPVVELFDTEDDWDRAGALQLPLPAVTVGDAWMHRLDNGSIVAGRLINLDAADPGRMFVFEPLGLAPSVAPDPNINLSFDLESDVFATPFQSVPIAALPPAVTSNPQVSDGSIASSSIRSLDLTAPPSGTSIAASPAGSIELGDLSFPNLAIGASPVHRLLLSQIPVAGGWDALLEGEPAFAGRLAQNITLGEVLHLPQVKALTLGELDLSATALGGASLAAIALGNTSVADLPIDPTSTDAPVVQWCELLTSLGYDCAADFGLDVGDPDAASNDNVTLLSLGLAGVPAGSIPAGSIPAGSIPAGSIPAGSIALADLDLQASPAGSIPAGSIDLASLPAGSIPAGSIPAGSIPAGSIPAGSIILQGTPAGSIPAGSIDLDNSPLGDVPVAAIDIGSLPAGSIPAGSIPAGSIPAGSIPAGSILFSLPAGSIPAGSIHLVNIDVDGTLLGDIHVKSLAIDSIPAGSIPAGSIPAGSIPAGSIPAGSIILQGTPAGSILIADIDVLGSALSGVRLARLTPALRAAVADCSQVDCTALDLTLGQVVTRGALAPGATFGHIITALTGIDWGEIDGAFDGITPEQIRAALDDSGFLLEDFVDYDDMLLRELPRTHAGWLQMTFGDLDGGFAEIDWGEIDAAFDGVTPEQVRAAIDATDTLLSEFVTYDDMVVRELPRDHPGFDALTFAHLFPGLSGIRWGDILEAFVGIDAAEVLDGLAGSGVTLAEWLTYDDVTLAELGAYNGTTLGELLAAVDAAVLDALTLGELLLALVSRTEFPWERLGPETVAAIDQPGDELAFQTTVQVTAGPPSATVEIRYDLPDGWTVRQGPNAATARQEGDEWVVTLTGVPNGSIAAAVLLVDVGSAIGAVEVTAEATVLGTDLSDVATDSATVVEGGEPNDTIATATPLAEDNIVLSHVSTSGDVDLYRFTVNQPGTRVSAILSNLDADLDLVLYSPPGVQIGTPNPRPLIPVDDDGATAAEAGEGSDAVQTEVLNDVPLADRPVRSVSARRGTSDERIDTSPLSRVGDYHLQVTGYNGATNREPYMLRFKTLAAATAPACPSRFVATAPAGVAPASLPPGTNTVILWNQQRVSGLYSPADAALVQSQLSALVAATDGDPTLGVEAAVVAVDGNADVRAAYQVLDASPCSPEAANGVSDQIVELLDGYRAQGTRIQYVVVVGSDDVIPFVRVPDAVTLSNERSYTSTFADGANQLSASFAAGTYMTDDAYGDADPYRLGDRTLFVTDAAVGRLVEHPQDIAGAIDDFIAAGGALDPDTGMVTGYDFLTDGADAIADALQPTVGTADLDRTLISDVWTSDDLEAVLLPPGGAPALASINAHFDHFRALPGLGNATGDEANLFMAQAIRDAAPGSLIGSLLFSMGCHSGLSVSDLVLPGGDRRAEDFAQVVAEQGGVWIGNTGYGYGDTEVVALAERLFERFGARLDGSMSIGQALLFAKQEYAADLTVYGVYDEKVLMESTFYGLPFYRLAVADPPEPPAPPAPPQVLTDAITGIETSTVGVTPDFDATITPDGTYWSNPDPDTGVPQHTVVHDRPILPRTDVDITQPDPADPSALGLEAHGALVTQLTSIDITGVDPRFARPIVDSTANEPEPAVVDVSFPASPFNVTSFLTPGGERQQLTITTGQFRSTASDGTGRQRNFTSIGAVVFYTEPGGQDFTAPTITLVDGVVVDGVASFTVRATDDVGGADGVTRVQVLVATDPQAGVELDWTALNLARTPGTDRWTGSMSVTSEELEIIAQAVDGSGNVGTSSNKAFNYRADAPVDPPSPTLVVNVDGTAGQNGWLVSDATVTAAAGPTAIDYTVDGSAPVEYTGPFTVSGEGAHVVVARTADGQQVSRSVRIDAVGPTAYSAAPTAAAAYALDSGVTADTFCLDAGSGVDTCTATLDGSPLANGADLTTALGDHTVTVQGTDVAGNAGHPLTVAYRVVDLTTSVSGPAGLSGWYTGPVTVAADNGGAPIEVAVDSGSFVAYTGPVVVTGDGTHTVTFRTPQEQMDSETIRIDATAPTVTIVRPAAGANYEHNSGVTASFSCSDATSGLGAPAGCTATLDGTPIVNGGDLTATSGGHSFAATATDVAGNTATPPAVAYSVSDPITLSPIAVTSEGGIIVPGTSISFVAVFQGAPGPYTALWTWGDGTTCAIPPGPAGCGSINGPVGGFGLVTGTKTFTGTIPATITLQLTNGSGVSVTATLSTTGRKCTILGTTGNNTINGTTGNDVICGLAGNDTINGKGGNDVVLGGAGGDKVNGDDGDDQVYGQADDDTVTGGNGNDLVTGGDGKDSVDGGAHNDAADGGAGNDTVKGGTGDDFIVDSGGTNTLEGGDGRDIVVGGPGNETLRGGNGNDDLYGNAGNETLDGGAGTDLCDGGSGTTSKIACER